MKIEISTMKENLKFYFIFSGKTKLVDILCTLSNHYCNIDTIDDSVTGSFQQVDLNRHLEEIAQKIEATLVRYQQNCLLNQNKVNASHFIKLLKQWETFVGSSHNYQNGEFFFDVVNFSGGFFIINVILKKIY